MMKLGRILLLIFSTCRVAVTAHGEVPPVNETCIPDGIVSSDDYFTEKAVIGDAVGLDITYHGYYKIVHNLNANITYLLHQCGSDPPQEEMDGRHQLVLPVPLQGGVVITSTSQIPHLEILGLRSHIKAFAGNPVSISSPCLLDRINDDHVDIIFDEQDPWNPPVDAYVEQHPDVVVIGGPFDDKTRANYFIVSESTEKTNEGIFEWNKAYAALFNKEAESNAYFDEIVGRYDCISETAAAIATDDKSPVVLWAYYSAYQKGWDVANCPNYYCEYAAQCSVTMLEDPTGQSLNTLNDTEFMELAKDADIWIFPSLDWDDIYSANKDMLDQFAAVKNMEVYDYQVPGPHAWFEQRFAEFDAVMQDFCDVTGHISGVRSRVWFRNVFSEPVGNLGNCTADHVNDPLPTRASVCTLPSITSDATTTTTTKFSSVVTLLIIVGTLTMQLN